MILQDFKQPLQMFLITDNYTVCEVHIQDGPLALMSAFYISITFVSQKDVLTFTLSWRFHYLTLELKKLLHQLIIFMATLQAYK